MSGNTIGKLYLRDLVRREPRAGVRRRRGRLPARNGALRRRHPARARPAEARHLASRHPAAGVGRDRDPLRRVRRPHDRYADRLPDPQRGPAEQGLRKLADTFRPGPRRLHLLAEIRRPGLPRRRARVGARDDDPRRGRRHREEMAARALRRRDPRAPRAARSDPDRLQVVGRGRRRTRSSLPIRTSCRSWMRSWTSCAVPATRAARG